MRRGVPQGYTIVEVMIFLSISAVLFVMIALTFGVQRGRTQFQTGAREVETRIRDIANDVSSGFYPTSNDFTCTAGVDGPEFTNAPSDQGTNKDCIFMGRLIRFNISGNPNRYNVHAIVGLRQVAGREVTTTDEAQPHVVTDNVSLRQEETLPNGIEIAYVRVDNNPPNLDNFGFLSTLGSYDASGENLEPGSLDVGVIIDTSGGVEPTTGERMVVCMNSGTSDQHAILEVHRGLGTDMRIASGSCP